MRPTTTRPGQGGKNVAEKASYAIGHRIRIEILALLNEAVYTADDLGEIIGESRQNVHHHLKELLSGGSIEIAKVEKRRNADLHYYRAVEMPEFDEQQLAAMPEADRADLLGLTVQRVSAEIWAALAAGKLHNDPRVVVAWRWFNLDEQGRQDLVDEQVRFWQRIREIEAEATNRRARTGEDAKSYVVAEWGFERSRKAPVPPSVEADKSADPF